MDASAWREKERQRQREREKEREMGKASERILYGGPTFNRETFKVVRARSPKKKTRENAKAKDGSASSTASTSASPTVKLNGNAVLEIASPSTHEGKGEGEGEGESETNSTSAASTPTFTPSLAKPNLKRVWSAGRARPRSPVKSRGESAQEAASQSHHHHAQHGAERGETTPTQRPPRFRRQCSADSSIPRREAEEASKRVEESSAVAKSRSKEFPVMERFAVGTSTMAGVGAVAAAVAAVASSKAAASASAAREASNDARNDARAKPKEASAAVAGVTKEKEQSSSAHRPARKAAHESGHKERKAKKRPVRIKYESTEIGPNGRREITHASLGKLVARLTDAHQYEVEFRDAFLLSYRCFCSPYEFIKKLIKRYTAVMAVCGCSEAKGLPESSQSTDEAKKEEARAGATTNTAVAKRGDAHSTSDASASVMRVLSVLKYWIKESGFIEMDLYSDRRSQKKLLAFLSEIQVSTTVTSIRQHAQSLYMSVAQIVRNQPTLLSVATANAGQGDTFLNAPPLTPSTSMSSSNDPLSEDLSSSPSVAKPEISGDQSSKLASAISMLKLTRSSSDSKKDRTAAPRLQRVITAGNDLPEHDHTRNPLEDVIHDTVHRSRLVASRANATKTSYDNARPFSGITAQELADQMTLIEAENYFSRINPRELMNKSWTRESKHRDAPHVMGIIDLFDATAQWISSEILHPQLQAAERAKLISLFVDAAENCLQLNNFNSLFEIITGLSSHCIGQLNTTWGLMNTASLDKYQSLMQICSPEDNYRNYRNMFLAAEGQPRLPCSFILVKDLFALEESMKTIEEGLIHWSKFRKISKIIYELLDRQNTNYLPSDGSSAVGISRKGRGALHHDRNMQVQIRHRLETIRKDSAVLFQLARNANTQESIMFVTSLSEAGFL